MRAIGLLAAIFIAGTVVAGDAGEGLVEEKSYNPWHFRIGPVMSPRVRVNVRGPRFALPTMPNSRTTGTGKTVEPKDAYVDRQYADGYVRLDEATLDTETDTHGLTWDWGADSVAAQYSSSRKEISFHSDMTHREESVSSTSFRQGSGSDGDRDFLIGVEAMGGWTFFDNRTFDAAIDAGFRFYGSGNIDAETRYGTSITTTRNEYRVMDTYDVFMWEDQPTDPHGNQDYNNPGPDYLIYAKPKDRKEDDLKSSTSRTENHYYSGGTKLNYRIWDLRLGPTVGWHVTDWFTLRGGVYGLLGLVDASLKTGASTSAGPMGASASTCGAVFGMAFGLSAQVNLTDNLFLMGGVEYDWWTDSVDLNAGGANAEIKLSDMSISLGLGVEF